MVAFEIKTKAHDKNLKVKRIFSMFFKFCTFILFQYEYVYLRKIYNEAFSISFLMIVDREISNLERSELTANKQVCY